MINEANDERRYDFIVVGAGAAGSVLAAELSASGASVLVIESGGPDDAATIANPSVWFYNVGGPLDYHLPIVPSPQLNNRKFNMALGHVLGGGTSINAMVWIRGTQADYDGWAENGARGWAFADVLPVFKSVLRMLRDVAGIDQVLFRTDFPYLRRDLAVNAKQRTLEISELNDSESRAVLGGNASRLFPRLYSLNEAGLGGTSWT